VDLNNMYKPYPPCVELGTQDRKVRNEIRTFLHCVPSSPKIWCALSFKEAISVPPAASAFLWLREVCVGTHRHSE
jgi:hypothetical protein